MADRDRARAQLAFVVMAALGQAIASARTRAGRGIVVKTVARIAGVLRAVPTGSGMEFRASNLSGSAVAGACRAVGGLSFTISIGCCSATLLAVVLLFRAGRAVADRAGGPMLARVVHGMKRRSSTASSRSRSRSDPVPSSGPVEPALSPVRSTWSRRISRRSSIRS